MFTDLVNALAHITLVDVLDILLVTFIIYSFLRLIKDTRAYQMAVGLVIIGLFYLITSWAKLVVSHRLIKSFTTYVIIAVIVLFQGEIRRFLTGLGSRSFRRPFTLRALEEKLEDLFLAVDYLSQKRIGALIAVEKEFSLKAYADRGTRLDALLSKDLLANIFFPHSPLHDGAVIVQGNKILSAGCLLPLPASHNLGEEFLARTRHLAALGLSQETDAAVIVVSEETGTISLAVKGRLTKIPDKDHLKEQLLRYLE
ncbi:MAG: diadenylate cyclase CdaA [Acidobacteriota bacterium]